MDNYDLIGALKAYADSQGWVFLSGTSAYQNYEASQNEYEDEQLVLAADFDARPDIAIGSVEQISYQGVLMLGRKFDADSTPASLDETYYQKYLARLKELMGLLSGVIITFSCANELDVLDVIMRMDIDTFDTNIDFVAATITFVQ
jgi:hypothetical protein